MPIGSPPARGPRVAATVLAVLVAIASLAGCGRGDGQTPATALPSADPALDSGVVHTRAGAVQLAEKLLDCIREPLPGLADGESLGASIGICVFTGGQPGSNEPDEIIRQADRAMYRAKAGGKNRHAHPPP